MVKAGEEFQQEVSWLFYTALCGPQLGGSQGEEVSGVEERGHEHLWSWSCQVESGQSPGCAALGFLLLKDSFCQKHIFFSSFFRCPAWLKIRCTYLMAEPSQGPLNQGRMGTRRLIGIWEDWEVFLGLFPMIHLQIQSQFLKEVYKNNNDNYCVWVLTVC